jgi:hypothetical protein
MAHRATSPTEHEHTVATPTSLNIAETPARDARQKRA